MNKQERRYFNRKGYRCHSELMIVDNWVLILYKLKIPYRLFSFFYKGSAELPFLHYDGYGHLVINNFCLKCDIYREILGRLKR